VLELLKKCGVW